MVVAALMALAGVCLGILLANARIPQVTVLPLLSTIVIALLGAVVVLLLDVSNFAAAALYVLTTVVASVTTGAWFWKQHLPELPHSYGWFCTQEFLRPNYLRLLHTEALSETSAATKRTVR